MNRNLIKFSIVATLFFSLTVSRSSASEGSTANKSFLWHVKSKTASVYLLGSVHFFKPSFYPLAPAIESAYKNTDNLVLEVDLSAISPVEMQQKMLARAMYKGSETIEDTVDSETLGLLREHLTAAGLPYDQLKKFKPGMLATTLTIVELMKLGFSAESGIDQYFMKKAQSDKKPIMQLETFDDQLELLFGMPQQDLFLKYTLMDIANMENVMSDIVSMWKGGDADGLQKKIYDEPLKKNPEFAPIIKKMIDDRNEKMAEKIKGFLKTDKSYLVVVGSAHLTGDIGIVHLLKGVKGVTINQK